MIIYTNHSGGAAGADKEWKDQGHLYGVKTIDWRPEHLDSMFPAGRQKTLESVWKAAEALKRPKNFKGIELVQRNWFQAYHAQAIYAVAHITPPGGMDYKGFTNETGKEIVAGGTGWAVEMAIQMSKPVYVFDMGTNVWHMWKEITFVWVETPVLTETFAGIGSRLLSPQGIQAISDVYKKTFTCTT